MIRLTLLFSSCDVPISEGPVNLSWPAIMKMINEEPHEFYVGGGWSFVTGAGEVSILQSSLKEALYGI